MISKSAKFYHKADKLLSRYIERVPYSEYQFPGERFDKMVRCDEKHGTDKFIYLYTQPTFYFEKRQLMCKVLKDTKHIRTGKKWSTSEAICFMHEVIEMEKRIELMTSEEHKEMMKDIGERYNVSPNRLKSIVMLFLWNLRKGVDKFDIYHYFTFYEIMVFKYRDTDALQEALEEGKLSYIEENLARELLT